MERLLASKSKDEKKTPQPFKRQLNCWKQLKWKPPTLCTQKHQAPALCQNHGPGTAQEPGQGLHCHGHSGGSWFILESTGPFCFPCFLRLREWRTYGCCLGCQNGAVAQWNRAAWDLLCCSVHRSWNLQSRESSKIMSWLHSNCPVCIKVCDVERFVLNVMVNWTHGTILLFQSNPVHYEIYTCEW